MARQDEKDGGKTKDFLYPMTSSRHIRKNTIDPATGLPKLTKEQQKLLERLVKIERDRMRAEDEDRTDY